MASDVLGIGNIVFSHLDALLIFFVITLVQSDVTYSQTTGFLTVELELALNLNVWSSVLQDLNSVSGGTNGTIRTNTKKHRLVNLSWE